MASEKKSPARDAAELGAIGAAGAVAGYAARHGIITKRGEFRALLREGAPLDRLEQHPHLKRSIARMERITPTDKKPGFGTPEFFNKRAYKVEGQKVVGDARLVERLTKIAPTLGYTDAGLPAPKASPLRTERKATIIIGPPAAGKSTVANDIARKAGAAIVDPDVVKKAIPEFKRGLGANAVHEESSALTKNWQKAHVERGHNLVIPRVGDNPEKLVKGVQELRAAGYKVNVVNVAVPSEVAMTRMLRRFDQTGRLVNPDYAKSIGSKPAAALQHVAKLGVETSTIDLSKNTPMKAPAGLKAALTGQNPRAVQAATRTIGRGGLAGVAALAVAKVAEMANRRPAEEAGRSGFQRADGSMAQKTYTDAQKQAFLRRRSE